MNVLTPDQILPSSPKTLVIWEDFLDSIAANWTSTVTSAGSGDSAASYPAEANGVQLLTTDDADNDRVEAQHSARFYLGTANKVKFLARVRLTTIGQLDYGVGAIGTDTDWLGDAATFSEGFIFFVADGSSTLQVKFSLGGSSETFDTGITLAAATWYDLCLEIQPSPNVTGQAVFHVFINQTDMVRDPNYTDTTSKYSGAALVGFVHGLQAGEAVAKTARLDCIGIEVPRL